MLGGLGQPGAPRRGWRGGDRSQRVAQAPEWVDESQPKGRRKKGGVGRGAGQAEVSQWPALPKASVHLTGGETEAQEVAGPCRGFAVRTGGLSGGESWAGRRPSPLLLLDGKRSVRWPGFPITHCQGQAVRGLQWGRKGFVLQSHQGKPMASVTLRGLGLTPSYWLRGPQENSVSP